MIAMLCGGWLSAGGGAGSAVAQPGHSADEGMRIFKSANCMGCHKWSGVGGGGYGGAAANLRLTKLTMEQIQLTIRCGRPATGMPHFEADAYSDGHCYGLKAADLPAGQKPPEPDHSLRAADVEAVATYVETHIKNQGEPNLAQCQAFFGTGTRVCDIYMADMGAMKQQADSSGGVAATPPDQVDAPARRHVTVDTAADANASGALSQK
jgi:mono/diheme cytochrome c family protein